MNLYISNGLIVDPGNNLESLGDLVIEDGVIKEISLYKSQSTSTVKNLPGDDFRIDEHGNAHLDAMGKWVVPGLVDIHVHLREPGFEYKEDVASGCRSAARGGFTTICCMPNTNPVIDCAYIALMVNSRAEEANGVQVLCIGAATKGQDGKELADYEGMLRVGSHSSHMTDRGICGISEDGKTVQNGELMLAAMKKAKMLGLTFFSHAEPESQIVERDLALAEIAGCRLHFCHISEKKSIDLIREAKKKGLPVTAETAPHYFSLCSSDVKEDTNKKMNPPLRQMADVEAVRQALKDGTIDAIATDHAPHHEKEKARPFEEAPNGVIGLETSFAVSYTELVKTGILKPVELIKRMSTAPAEVIGIERGSLWIGKPADLAIIDVNKEYEIRPEDFESKGKNSPFVGSMVSGQVECTIVGGTIVWRADREETQKEAV
jgi:dihydroorotase